MGATVLSGRRKVWLMAAGLGLLWLGAIVLQHRSPPATLWAALDAVAHGAAAGLCTVWLWPAFGARPVLSAMLAGTLIDLDHAVAAHSLDPHRMMSLDARPPTHSLAGAAVFGVLAWAAFGVIDGYAVAIGVLAHLLGDAVEPAGVPFLAPFVAYAQMHVPTWALGLGIGLSACASAALARRGWVGGRIQGGRCNRVAGVGLDR